METTAKYYQSISDLPLSKFIDCLVDDNLFALVITGQPTQEQLSRAWENIMLDYNDAMGDYESKMYISLLKDVTLIQGKIKLVEIALMYLPHCYDKEMHDDLNLYTESNLKLDVNNPGEYAADLEKAARRAKKLNLLYNLKKSQLDGLEANNKDKNVKPTRVYFQSVLITLSDFAKYQLQEAITVYQFCERVRRYGQHIKMMEDNDKKRR